MKTAFAQQLALLAAVLMFSGCSFFQPQPALPRHAAVEPGGTEQEFVRLIQGADIIYFPSEAAALASRSDPAWKLLAALGGSDSSFAIGWDSSGNERVRRDFLNEASKSGGKILVLDEADQLVADRIVNYFGEHRYDKVLVFIRRERLGLGTGVPYLVAQQTKARQLILNPRKSPVGTRLLTRN